MEKTVNKNGTDYVTVVAVGAEEAQRGKKEVSENTLENDSGYVTVLKIGHVIPPKEIIEEVLVYRLPGERLGFGLKFEGGTRAAEFVKRLFIQSCAPDSPASMVHCSWGKLTEGDEVLHIDSLPVTSMTRIDCVRCLKDSNVVIKLLVKHVVNKSEDGSNSNDDSSAREDLSNVISADKMRIPPPPPPVPPRRIPRKALKEIANVPVNTNTPAELDHSPLHHIGEALVNGHRNARFHSPRSSGKFAHSRQSPEVSRHGQRDRRLSDGSIGPPDAEVYLDLFSQESGCSLSESDDTGSSISTIIDRFGSFPTTTNSSLAGSLPSTPTSLQKKLDMSNISNAFDKKSDFDDISGENYLFSKLTSENGVDRVDGKSNDDFPREKPKDDLTNEDGTPLQPPMNFQDAPLNYGNESVALYKSSGKFLELALADENGNCLKGINYDSINRSESRIEFKKRPPPPPPPCEKLKGENKETDAKSQSEEMDCGALPRLVDFVPKCNKSQPQILELVKLFLENEIRQSEELYLDEKDKYDLDINSASDIYNSDMYNSSWGLSSQLATIGEDDEDGYQESCHRSSSNSTPIVIIENADNEGRENSLNGERKGTPDGDGYSMDAKKDDEDTLQTYSVMDSPIDTCEVMERPPTSSRQPPDGDEFPDYHETPITGEVKIEVSSPELPPSLWNSTLWKTSSLFRDQQSSCSVRDKIAIFSTATTTVNDLNRKKIYKSTDDITSSVEKESTSASKTSSAVLQLKNVCEKKETFRSSCDFYVEEEVPKEAPLRRHSHSQSLMDISSLDQKKDKWNLLAEQRQKSLSKLKGLIIPEKVTEVDTSGVVDLPEIRSNNVSFDLPKTPIEPPIVPCQRNLNIPSLTTPPWSSSNISNVPKYSPAFKRKSLQIHNENLPKSWDSTCKSSSVTSVEPEIIPKRKPVKESAPPERYVNQESKISGGLCSADAPKSLESITSPTRSDCSFEYLNSSVDIKNGKQESIRKTSSHGLNKEKEDTGRLEDDSDNDSAVSSSQSSYISRTSPPMSPSHLYSNFTSRVCNINESDSFAQLKCHSTGSQPHSQSRDNQNHRLLKPQSVEAINRKNILASAKCRSGRDIKIGSPLIQRKFEEDAVAEENTDRNQTESEKHKILRVSSADAADNSLKKDIQISSRRRWSHQVELPTQNGVNGTEDLLDTPVASRSSIREERTSRLTTDLPRKLLPRILGKDTRSASVTDLRKSFEKLSPAQMPVSVVSPSKKSGSSTSAIKNNLIQKALPVPKSSSEQVVAVEEIKQKLDKLGFKDVDIIVLRPEIPGGSVGITLAGGADYENKEVTVHKIRENSAAHRNGRLQKGDKVVSINGKGVKGLTHRELVSLLKEPLAEVTLAIYKRGAISEASALKNAVTEAALSPIKEKEDVVGKEILVVSLVKDAAGLGLSLEGGQDSPLGNVPLQIKKIFKGGAAEKCGKLQAGDELLLVNDKDVSLTSRFEVWSMLKKLPEGVTVFTIRR